MQIRIGLSASQRLTRVYEMPELKACPIQTTFRLIGKKWTVEILREMFLGTTQFNRIEEKVKGITPKVLAARLKELEHNGMVDREIVSKAPIRIEYRLTEFGQGIGPVLLAAGAFSMVHSPKIVFKDGRPHIPQELTDSNGSVKALTIPLS